jgi:hypothetical protein
MLLILAAWLVVGVALALVVFNLHQVGLVFVVTALGERLPLPWIKGLPRATVLAVAFALVALVLALVLLFGAIPVLAGLAVLSGVQITLVELLALPFFAIPCYMLAAELATGWRDDLENRHSLLFAATAVTLRWLCRFYYAAFILGAFAVSYSMQWPGQAPQWHLVLAVTATVILLGYLLLAPVFVLLLMSVFAQIQRRILRLLRAARSAGP